MPVYATLQPMNGNPDLEISIIKNMSESKADWIKYSLRPQFVSQLSFAAD